VQCTARTTVICKPITNDKCRQIIITYFGARNLHRKLLDSPWYFASKFLQHCVHRMLGKLKLKNCRHSLIIYSRIHRSWNLLQKKSSFLSLLQAPTIVYSSVQSKQQKQQRRRRICLTRQLFRNFFPGPPEVNLVYVKLLVAYTVVHLVTPDCTRGVIDPLYHSRHNDRDRQYECDRGIMGIVEAFYRPGALPVA